jgi:6-phosphogluconolactonase (cycloisomerase 2 family)
MHPNGRFMYAMHSINSGNFASAYSTSLLDGKMTPLSPSTISAPNKGQHLAIDPTGRYLYAGVFAASSTVQMYSINQSTGALTSLGTFASAGSWNAGMRVDPSGRFVYYACNQGSGTVCMMAINRSNGNLSTIGSGTIAIGGAGNGIQVDPTGRFVFAGGATNAYSYTADGSTGALTATSPTNVSTPAFTTQLAADRTGRFLYTTHQIGGAACVTQNTINQSTGVLTAMAPQTVNAGGSSMGIDIETGGRFLYTVDYNTSGFVYQFSVNRVTGALTALSTASVSAGQNPTYLFLRS